MNMNKLDMERCSSLSKFGEHIMCRWEDNRCEGLQIDSTILHVLRVCNEAKVRAA